MKLRREKKITQKPWICMWKNLEIFLKKKEHQCDHEQYKIFLKKEEQKVIFAWKVWVFSAERNKVFRG